MEFILKGLRLEKYQQAFCDQGVEDPADLTEVDWPTVKECCDTLGMKTMEIARLRNWYDTQMNAKDTGISVRDGGVEAQIPNSDKEAGPDSWDPDTQQYTGESPDLDQTASWADLITVAKAGDRAQVLACLQERGADMNQADENDFTALIWAALNGHAEVVSALLEAGANKAAKTNRGKTALDWAIQKGHPACVEILRGGKAEQGESALEALKMEVCHPRYPFQTLRRLSVIPDFPTTCV